MKKIILILVVILLVFVSFVTGYIYNGLKSVDKAWQPQKRYYTISFIGELETTFYIRTCVWGLLGQHHNIIISTKDITSKNWKFDILEDYEFFSDEIFYKFQAPDTLIIYTNHIIDKPANFNSNIKIIQKELNQKSERDNKESITKITARADF
ncbi:MAG: hypothetical protein LBN95_01195 [Prevotellaceae bacterium]|jgi:hypothetical protein|nr:hypothetical protein [Prevotellaceae bacterium]